MILWVDLETTGLAKECSIIEIACVLTDKSFEVIDQFESLVKLPRIPVVETYALNMHVSNGLWDEVLQAEHSIDWIDSEAEKFVSQATEKLVLAGSSVHFDRGFIETWMPRLNSKLHYRNLDMSSIKQFVHYTYNIALEDLPGRKSDSKHRAMDDINVSIESAKWYGDFLVPSVYPWEESLFDSGRRFFGAV